MRFAIARLARVVVAASLAASLTLHVHLAAAQRGAQQRAQRRAQPAAIRPQAIDSLRARIRFLLDSTKAPSLAVAVTKGGRIVWEEGFGYADVASHTPATAATLYSMASISKPLTATALMTLVERGKVALDRPANDYLGATQITGLAGDARAATVRRVLSHTAGLPLHYRFFYEGGDEARPSMDEAIARYAIVVYPPGTVYNYSNLGYGVIEEIIARAAGTSYEDYMRGAVFAPLGMPTTTVGTGRGIANAATRYDAAMQPIPFYDFDHRGASAVFTSAHELARFAMFHLRDHLRDQQRILSDTTILAMQRLYTPGDTVNGYGLGWGIGEDNGWRTVSHTGGMPGVATVLMLYPSEDVAIVALANQSTPLPFIVGEALASVAIPGYAEKAAARARIAPPPRTAFAAPAELQGEWTGTLRTYDGATVPLTLLVKSDDVHVRLGGPRELWTVLNGASFRQEMLAGRFAGTIPTDDARRHAHTVSLSLSLADGKLRGYAAAVSTTTPVAGAISSYVELTRAGQPASQ